MTTLMRILVTGGAGFIGSHLVDFYLSRGEEVFVLDDFSSGHRQNLVGAHSRGAQVLEVSLQKDSLGEILKDVQPDLISHHAAQKSVRDSVTNPGFDAEVNILGLVRLMEAAKQTQCRKVIFASSGGVIYGEQSTHPAPENHHQLPSSPYGISKMASEHYLRFYAQEFGFSAACLRYANVFGPRQDPEGEAGVVAIFAKKILERQEVTIFGNGRQTRDYVYVADVIRANAFAEKVLNGFKVWNVGTGIETSVLSLYEKMVKIAALPSTHKFAGARAGEQMRSSLSYEALMRDTGWRPETELADGLKKTIEWFRNPK